MTGHEGDGRAHSNGRSLSVIPVAINIGKNKTTPNERAADDYRRCLARPVFVSADFFVVNISSPNTPDLRKFQHGGVLEADCLFAMKEELESQSEKHGVKAETFCRQDRAGLDR